MLDAMLGYWHVPLDKESSLLTTFNTPWGKSPWLGLPFGLKVAGDVFQERIDTVMRNVPNSAGIVDDIRDLRIPRRDEPGRLPEVNLLDRACAEEL